MAEKLQLDTSAYWYLAGCYSLDLYCKWNNPAHAYAEFPHNFNAELGSTCRKLAKRAGWIIHRDNTATCPKCAKLQCET